MFDLHGKVALVTGGARGIGKKVAEVLAAGGAQVIRSDRAPEEAGAGVCIRHDVTVLEDWQAVLAHVSSGFGRLDILVNNAGIILNKPFVSTTIDEFRSVYAINVESVWTGMQLAAPLMEQGGGGSIVNLSSVYGQIAGPMQAAYSASKGAVRLLTKAVAVEFARNRSGIRVNSVHPGPVETELGFSALGPAVAAGRFADFESAREYVASLFPMGRWASTDDIAGAVLFLASDASKFVTGTELVVDGGYSIV
ncbi:MAG TPA: SDR family oxidoreductase [Steroidobacteraceae bacterium]|nr:SDR family oxidoreductase [Steroidobacteraceae bacterium]